VSTFGRTGSCIRWVLGFGIKTGYDRIPWGCQACRYERLSYTPSAITSFTSIHSISSESKNYISGPMQTAVRKKRKWDSLVTILSWSWPPKIWTTLPAFYPLLTQLCPPNGLEVIEFWRSTSLLISVSRQNSGWKELNFWVSDWPKLWKSRILV
jgi:hypothetical protein